MNVWLIFWVLFAVLNAIYISGLLWCIMAIRTTTRIGAEIFDLHTDQLAKLRAEMTTLRESSFPRYTDAVVSLPIGEPVAESPEVADMPWAAHDAAVSDAIANRLPGRATEAKLAQNAAYSFGQPDHGHVYIGDEPVCAPKSGGVVGLPDPETAPFFTQSTPEK